MGTSNLDGLFFRKYSTWGWPNPNPKPRTGLFCKYCSKANCWICSCVNPASGLKLGKLGVFVLDWPEFCNKFAKGFKLAPVLNPKLDWSEGWFCSFCSAKLNLLPIRLKSSLNPGGGLTLTSCGPSRLKSSWSLNSYSPENMKILKPNSN